MIAMTNSFFASAYEMNRTQKILTFENIKSLCCYLLVRCHQSLCFLSRHFRCYCSYCESLEYSIHESKPACSELHTRLDRCPKWNDTQMAEEAREAWVVVGTLWTLFDTRFLLKICLRLQSFSALLLEILVVLKLPSCSISPGNNLYKFLRTL